MDNGMTREDYHFFMHHSPKHHCIMGNDYYVTNEHHVTPDGQTQPSGEIFGYDEITRQYYDRFASDEARFITGTTLIVDGGRLDILS